MEACPLLPVLWRAYEVMHPSFPLKQKKDKKERISDKHSVEPFFDKKIRTYLKPLKVVTQKYMM